MGPRKHLLEKGKKIFFYLFMFLKEKKKDPKRKNN